MFFRPLHPHVYESSSDPCSEACGRITFFEFLPVLNHEDPQLAQSKRNTGSDYILNKNPFNSLNSEEHIQTFEPQQHHLKGAYDNKSMDNSRPKFQTQACLNCMYPYPDSVEQTSTNEMRPKDVHQIQQYGVIDADFDLTSPRHWSLSNGSNTGKHSESNQSPCTSRLIHQFGSPKDDSRHKSDSPNRKHSTIQSELYLFHDKAVSDELTEIERGRPLTEVTKLARKRNFEHQDDWQAGSSTGQNGKQWKRKQGTSPSKIDDKSDSPFFSKKRWMKGVSTQILSHQGYTGPSELKTPTYKYSHKTTLSGASSSSKNDIILVEHFENQKGNRKFNYRDRIPLLQKVGEVYIDKLGLKASIDAWIQDLFSDIRKNLGAIPGIVENLKHAESQAHHAFLAAFLGCVKVFQHQPHDDDNLNKNLSTEALFFFQKRFEFWRKVSVLDFDIHLKKFQGNSAEDFQWTNPESQIAYLIKIPSKIFFSYTIIKDLYEQWVTVRFYKTGLRGMNSTSKTLFKKMMGLNYDLVDHSFVQHVCVHDSEFMKYLNRISVAQNSRKIFDGKYVTIHQFLEKVGSSYITEKINQIYEEAYDFFKDLQKHLNHRFIEQNKHEPSERHIDKFYIYLKGLDKATKNCGEMVILGFIPSLISLYPGEIKKEELENAVLNGWNFLRAKFVEWGSLNLNIKDPNNITFVRKTSRNTFSQAYITHLDYFQYLMGYNAYEGLPLSCINILLDAWVKVCEEKVSSGRSLGFKIPFINGVTLQQRLTNACQKE